MRPSSSTVPHLPLGVDSYIAEAYLARVMPLLPPDLPATFLPVQKIGQSDEHLAFPGTLSFSADTIIARLYGRSAKASIAAGCASS